MKIQIADLYKKKKAFDSGREWSKDRFVDSLSDRRYSWKTDKTTQTLFHVSDNIEGTVFHKNYLSYLEEAWANHYGVVVTPDIIWYTLLCEVATMVKASPEKYAKLFTTSDKKEMLIIATDSEWLMPADRLFAALKSVVPIDVELFAPRFSTSTWRSMISRYIAFADVVSPYYEYMTSMCGIPYVDVLGTEEDWRQMVVNWGLIGKMFEDEYDEEYFEVVGDILSSIVDNMGNAEFWGKMFSLDNCCGSGHPSVVGWFGQLFRKIPASGNPGEYASHVAGISYKNLESGKNFKLFTGVFGSVLKEDLLVPDFACAGFEERK